MALLAGCPNFDYEGHPRKNDVLKLRIAEVVAGLRSGQLATLASIVDSRPIHRKLFLELTPYGFDYYAGHYRGENYRCLRFCEVQIRSDRRVGYPPHLVRQNMDEIAALIQRGVGALDLARDLPSAEIPDDEKVVYVVVFACQVFEIFLRVHPYINGNGHAARFIIWAILGRYGYWPVRWPIEPRPPDPPYSELIKIYRDGNKEPLEKFVLSCLIR